MLPLKTPMLCHLILLVALLGFAQSGAAGDVLQELGPDESGISAPAQPTYSLDAHPKPIRLNFDFREGESLAWLNEDGDFQVHGWITHRSLRCATYRMGVRFGAGSPACLNVQWLTEPVFVTSQLQCNSARANHRGGDTLPAMGARLERITCAERVIRCTGNCR
jgi:hypothetical protein